MLGKCCIRISHFNICRRIRPVALSIGSACRTASARVIEKSIQLYHTPDPQVDRVPIMRLGQVFSWRKANSGHGGALNIEALEEIVKAEGTTMAEITTPLLFALGQAMPKREVGVGFKTPPATPELTWLCSLLETFESCRREEQYIVCQRLEQESQAAWVTLFTRNFQAMKVPRPGTHGRPSLKYP